MHHTLLEKPYEKKAIEDWLVEYRVLKYEIKEQKGILVVDVNDSVDLRRFNLEAIDVQFGRIEGDFDIMGNRLKSLKGCPKIVGGGFYCDSNNLTSLMGGPEVLSGAYSCDNNLLTNLIGAPLIINDNFYATNNCLTSLEGIPIEIYGSLWLAENQIESLEFFSSFIKETIHLKPNPKLGALQEVKDFNTLFQCHLDYTLAVEQKKMLNESIQVLENKGRRQEKI